MGNLLTSQISPLRLLQLFVLRRGVLPWMIFCRILGLIYVQTSKLLPFLHLMDTLCHYSLDLWMLWLPQMLRSRLTNRGSMNSSLKLVELCLLAIVRLQNQRPNLFFLCPSAGREGGKCRS